MELSLIIAGVSLFVSIIGVIINYYYTKKSLKKKDILEEAVKAITDLITSINHWTGSIFFTFPELHIATDNIIRKMHDEKRQNILLKIKPYKIEIYSRDINNLRKEPVHYEFNNENNVSEFLRAFNSGEPVGSSLYFQSEPSSIFSNIIALKPMWALYNLNISIKNMFKYKDLIYPIDRKILSDIDSVIPSLLVALFDSLERKYIEVIIDESMRSKEIYNKLYEEIFYWQYLDYTLGWLQHDHINRLKEVQEKLFMKF